MPNNVSHKIAFTATTECAAQIIDEITKHGCLDFNALIPKPLPIYQGSLSGLDTEDFGGFTWYTWAKKNWGTKWNAYNGNSLNRFGAVELYFETAWSIPYPIIIAFANKYKLSFVHKYFDEGHNFWGIEKWENRKRTSRQRDNKADFISLCKELNVYDPNND